jgi:hexosaminidase
MRKLLRPPVILSLGAPRWVGLFAIVLAFSSGLPLRSLAQPTADFAVKAFHLDLRIQVMTMPALKTFAQKLHAGGINTLIMEYEATYPFQDHPLIPNRYAYTREEIVGFIAFCKTLGIDVIPLQQSFGHVEYILRHDRYKNLREDDKALSQVCPLRTVEDSLLFTELYSHLATTHPSPYIHIGCDETYLLGHCERCRKKVAEEGISRLYIDYVSMLCNIVLRLGKKPILWADMILKYPEAIDRLPKGTILVDWNYGWSNEHFGDHQKLMASGYTVWGAPAIRSHPDNFDQTQWEKHFNNIRDFIPACRQMGYKGMVLTSWSTSGAYSYTYETDGVLSDLQAIRHVYPITGFNILITAYIESLKQSAPLDIPTFIAGYCKKQYGFTPEQAQVFWRALTDTGITAAQTLRTLHPASNQAEYAQYILMADIRAQHLLFERILAEANAPTFTLTAAPGLAARLHTLLVADSSISRRFIALNKATFYPAELDHENALRTFRIRDLYLRLKKARSPIADTSVQQPSKIMNGQ